VGSRLQEEQQSLLFPAWNKQHEKRISSQRRTQKKASLVNTISKLFDRTASHPPQSWRDLGYICGSSKRDLFQPSPCTFWLRVTPLCPGQHPDKPTSEMGEAAKESWMLSASHPWLYHGQKK